MDRNWNEILQELRVTQTGTQIFTGFLLTIAFQARFDELTTFSSGSPSCHGRRADDRTRIGAGELASRLVPRGRKDDDRADRAHHHADHAGGVAVMLIGTVLLIFDLVLDRTAALIAAGVTLLVVIILAVLPPIVRSIRATHSTNGETKIS